MISFFIHNFMSACSLERDRVAACAFMVATADGPISMGLHNARRDDSLLRLLAVRHRASAIFWNPITGRLQNDPHPAQAPILPPKLRKGRNVLDTTAPDNGKALTLGPAHRLLSARDAAAGRS